MKFKSLLPLVLVLAVLLGLVYFQKSRRPEIPISKQVGLVPLIPEGIAATDIKKLELYNGAKPEEKLVLAWDQPTEKWRVTNHFNAPVDKEKIDKFITSLTKLKGEFRSEAAADADLESYGLTDAKAFHVVGYKADATEPAFRVLVGKAPSYDTIFMRSADNKNVYVESKNLKQDAGVTGDEEPPSPMPGAPPAPPKPATAPEATPWVDKNILKLAKDDIQKIELSTPDKKMLFELREKKVDPAKPEAEKKDETKPETPAAEGEKKPEPKVEHEWALASGGFEPTFKQPGLDTLVRKFDALTATDIVDPATKAKWGLDNPAFKCTLTVKGKDQPVVLEGGRPDPAGDGYLRVASNKEDVVYKVNSFTFEQVFPKGTDLFNLPALTVDSKTIDKIDITAPEGHLVLTKSGEEWTVTEPVADLKPQSSSLQSIATALSSWKPTDYADSADGKGLEASTRKITFTAGAGVTHTIVLGADSKNFAGAYAKLDDSPKVLAMSKSDITRIFIKPQDAYQRAILDADEAAITSVDIKRDKDPFALAKEGEAWKLTIAGAPAESNKEAIESFLSSLTSMQASDVLFGKTELDVPAEATLTFKDKDGKECSLAFSPEKDGKRQFKVSDKKEVFQVESATAQMVLPGADTLKKKEEPAPKPDAAKAPTAGPDGKVEPAATPVVIPAPAAPGAPVTITPAPAVPAPAVPAPAVPAPAVPAPAVPAPAVPAPAVPAPAAPAPAAPAPAAPAPAAPAPAAPAPAAPAPAAPAPAAPAPAAPAPAAPAPAAPAPAAPAPAAPAPAAPAPAAPAPAAPAPAAPAPAAPVAPAPAAK